MLLQQSVSGVAVSLLVSGLSACVRAHGVAVSLLVSGLSACVRAHGVAVSLLVSGLTVDILSTFCGVFMVHFSVLSYS